MKKLLLILLTVLTCFNAEAIPITHAAHPARVAAAANAARRQREKLAEKKHEEEFHHGELDCCEVELKESFTFKDSVPTIETYEIRKYYYAIDPDKCIIETKQELKSSRVATEQEIKDKKK